MTALIRRVADSTVAAAVPLSVHVDLTMRCNEKCVHCYRTIEDRGELTTVEVIALLDDLVAAGTLYLTFSGGEIFLRPDLFEILAEARRRRFDVRLKTNAMLVTAERARRLHELAVRQVDVSIYSADPAAHDRITAVPGSLVRTLAGVERLREAGVRVKLNTPLMAINARTYRDVQALAARLGALCGFDPMITTRNDGDRAPVQLRVSRSDLKDVLADPTFRGRGGAPVPAAGEPPPARPALDEIVCGAGHNAAYVSAYGDVMPCVSLPLACGNIREASFASLWSDSPRMREVRGIRVGDIHTCNDCEASAFCSRCPGQALVEDGDLYGPSRACCEHAQAASEVAGFPVIPLPLRSPAR